MEAHHTRTWSPITDLPENWRELASEGLAHLIGAWHERAEELRGQEHYDEFLLRMRREWAIETGILERIYTLSEGAARTFIEMGFDAALIEREDTDKPPALVVSMIQDQYQAIEGLYQFVSGQRRLSTSYLKQLHQVITSHQDYCDAVDSLGNQVQVSLLRGTWKQLPNNIRFEDGSKFEFCPPEQVDSEVERLLAWHEQHDRAAPDLEAAWLHHRFTLIHPFQDGNGRIARCLATLVFLKAKWFPLVVTRRDRSDYIAALRAADQGELRQLVELFGSLQKKAVREALSLSDALVGRTAHLDRIIAAARPRLNQRHVEYDARRVVATKLAGSLHESAETSLCEVARRLDPEIKLADPMFGAYVDSGGPNDEKAGFYRIQVVQCARSLGYYANLNEYHAWVALKLNMKPRTELLFSFHGMGRVRGVMAVSAMTYQKERMPAEEGGIETRFGEVAPLCSEPFEFTHLDDFAVVPSRFQQWFDACLNEGLARWSASL